MNLSEEEARRLSKLLWDARESVEMWADVVEMRHGEAPHVRGLVRRIDEFRAECGWSPHGFGQESALDG